MQICTIDQNLNNLSEEIHQYEVKPMEGLEFLEGMEGLDLSGSLGVLAGPADLVLGSLGIPPGLGRPLTRMVMNTVIGNQGNSLMNQMLPIGGDGADFDDQDYSQQDYQDSYQESQGNQDYSQKDYQDSYQESQGNQDYSQQEDYQNSYQESQGNQDYYSDQQENQDYDSQEPQINQPLQQPVRVIRNPPPAHYNSSPQPVKPNQQPRQQVNPMAQINPRPAPVKPNQQPRQQVNPMPQINPRPAPVKPNQQPRQQVNPMPQINPRPTPVNPMPQINPRPAPVNPMPHNNPRPAPVNPMPNNTPRPAPVNPVPQINPRPAPGNQVHPGPVTNTIAMGEGTWSTNLFDCFNDVPLFCLTCWLPCITFGQISEIVDRGTTPCGTSGSIYGIILAVTALHSIYSCTYRTKMRLQYGIPGDDIQDFCTHLWCEGCALLQEYRELTVRGYNVPLGWHANMVRQKQSQGIPMAPPVAPAGMTR